MIVKFHACKMAEREAHRFNSDFLLYSSFTFLVMWAASHGSLSSVAFVGKDSIDLRFVTMAFVHSAAWSHIACFRHLSGVFQEGHEHFLSDSHSTLRCGQSCTTVLLLSEMLENRAQSGSLIGDSQMQKCIFILLRKHIHNWLQE